MDKDKDRNKHMRKVLQGSDKLRIQGVDVNQIKVAEYEDLLDHVDYFVMNHQTKKEEHRPARKGELGCMMAHIRAWSTLMTDQPEVGIIMEDDIELNHGIQLSDIYKAIDNAPPDWQFLVFCFNRPRLVHNSKNPDYPYLDHDKGANYGLMAYAMRPQTALRLYANIPEKMDRPVDDWLRNNFFYKYRTYFCLQSSSRLPMIKLSMNLLDGGFSSTAGRQYNIAMLNEMNRCHYIYHDIGQERLKNDKNIIYVGNEGCPPLETLVCYLIGKAFPDKKLVARNYAPDVIIRSHDLNNYPEWNREPDVPYIYISSEPYLIKPVNSNDRLVIQNTLTNNSLWFPFMFHTYITEKVREVKSKDRFLAYCYSNKVRYREQVFDQACESFPNECWALGKCTGSENNGALIDHMEGTFEDLDYSRYYFVLALENSISQGYITEKVLQVAYQGAIPIYKGDDNMVKRLFNPNRVIYLDDFESVDKCLDYCAQIVADDDYTWRLKEPVFSEDGLVLLNSIIDKNVEIIRGFLDPSV